MSSVAARASANAGLGIEISRDVGQVIVHPISLINATRKLDIYELYFANRVSK
jgi:hypothetical protein